MALDSFTEEAVIQAVDPVTREPHEDEEKQAGLPSTIEIYLPGQLAWIDMLTELTEGRKTGNDAMHQVSWH